MDPLSKIENDHPLEGDWESDARYIWRRRWELAGQLIRDMGKHLDYAESRVCELEMWRKDAIARIQYLNSQVRNLTSDIDAVRDLNTR